MTKNLFDRGRRAFLRKMISIGMMGGVGVFNALESAAAMGARPIVEGMRRVTGEVRVNGALVQAGATVKPDDTITTGAKSHAVFVVGQDAFLLHDNSRVELSSRPHKKTNKARSTGIKTLHMKTGKLLSVFGRGRKTFVTSTAVCGVRGTGMYVEAGADRTYVCTCYGEVDLEALASPDARETVTTTHHEEPRYIYAKGAERMIEKAGMFNHTDKELTMLESLVGRQPPFASMPFNEYNDPYK